ncbi:TlpA disulfide reductase family protein [Pedobacter frigoris]|uniref:TlpA family protein disulfide reductase n=1 Tax=Pedobacter frigoris TaxID=2571272 RepID=UPI00292F141A|nr:TlpA disulfide reductase family protein [Pedobacter frigoris]
MKRLSLITAFICLIGLGVEAQFGKPNSNKTKADSVWSTRPVPFVGSEYKLPESYTPEEFILYKESKIKSNINKEMYARLLREWGIEFWKRFPEDRRKFQLFSFYEPAYFANLREGATAEFEGRFVVPLDTVAKNEWKRLSPEYFNEYTAAIGDSGNYYSLSRLALIPWNVGKWRNSANEKFDYEGHLKEVIVHLKRYPEDLSKRSKQGVLSITECLLINERRDYGLDEQDMEKYIGLLKATDFSSFHEIAIQLECTLKLEQEPLQLKAKLITGEKFDLKQFRGRLVLVDFWHPTCGGCVAMMPEIKLVYDKYKTKGFEVLSASLFYNRKDEFKSIQNIYDKIGADWPLVLLGGNKGESGRRLFEQYGWNGVPQVLLLDEEGKLIHFNSELRIKGGLESFVKQHFDRKSTENKSGR